MKTHLREYPIHKINKLKFNEAEFDKVAAECGISNTMPEIPKVPVPPVYGLPFTSAWSCNHCPVCYSKKAHIVAHIRDKHKDRSSNDFSACTAQRLNNSSRSSLFRIITAAPLPPPDLDTIFTEAHTFMDTDPKNTALPSDNRNISSWEYLSGFYKETDKHRPEEIRALVALPTDVEFPGLNDKIMSFVSACEDLIEKTPILIRRMLNSENRAE